MSSLVTLSPGPRLGRGARDAAGAAVADAVGGMAGGTAVGAACGREGRTDGSATPPPGEATVTPTAVTP